MMLWLTHFFPEEDWATLHKARSLSMLDRMWQGEGYFTREPYLPHARFAFTNYGVSIGLQAVGAWPERVDALNAYFESLPVRRRIRPRGDHARDGVQLRIFRGYCCRRNHAS